MEIRNLVRRAITSCSLAIIMAIGSIGSASAAELLVADRANNRVVALDEATGKYLRTVTSTGLDVPSGLTMGPNGLLYVSNFQAGFSPESAASVVVVDPNPMSGNTAPFILDVLGPGGVAYHSATNTLLVSEIGLFGGNRVIQYDAGGQMVSTIDGLSTPTGRTGMAFDSAGDLYVSSFNFVGPGSVLKYDVDNNFAPAGEFVNGATAQLAFPFPPNGFNGIEFDANGNLYAASLLGQTVIKYTVTNGVPDAGASFGLPIPYPSATLLSLDGSLIVSSLGNDNPGDPFYGDQTFPGTILRYNITTGAQTPLLMGDVDRNALVDGADGAAVAALLAAGSISGDLDGDFDTDGADILLWQQGLGNAGVTGAFQPTGITRYFPPGGEFAATPEPAGSALAAIAAMVCLIRRRGE